MGGGQHGEEEKKTPLTRASVGHEVTDVFSQW